MNIDNFIKERSGDWKKLEDTISRLQKAELRNAGDDDLIELGDLYRRVVSDLSFAKSNFRDVRLLLYLNQLTGKAFAKIYRDEPFSFSSFTGFFTAEFPRMFRSMFLYILAATAAFILSGVIGFFVVTADQKMAVYTEKMEREHFTKVQQQAKWANIESEVRPSAASMIMTNNIKVAFLAFAYGVTLGLGTFLVLINNGFMLGSTAGICYMKGVGFLLWSFVFPHGMIELTCIFISGGAGFLIADSFLRPGVLSRKDAFKVNSLAAVKLLAGVVPMLVVAGTIEGFVSPSAINGWLKITVGCLTLVLMFFYFFYAGREKAAVKAAKR